MNCSFLFVEDEKPYCIADHNQGCRLERGYNGVLCPYVTITDGVNV